MIYNDNKKSTNNYFYKRMLIFFTYVLIAIVTNVHATYEHTISKRIYSIMAHRG